MLSFSATNMIPWPVVKVDIWWYLKDNCLQFSIYNMLWVLIRIALVNDSNEYPQHHFNGEIGKIIPKLSSNTHIIDLIL